MKKHLYFLEICTPTLWSCELLFVEFLYFLFFSTASESQIYIIAVKTATQLCYESHHPDFFFFFLSYCTFRTQNWSLYPCICGARNFILQNDGKLFSFHSTKLQVRKSALLKEFEVRSCHGTSLNTYIAYVTFFFPYFWESFSPVITLGTRRALSYHPTKHHLEGLQHKN